MNIAFNHCSYHSLLLLLTLPLMGHVYAQNDVGSECALPQGKGACQLIYLCKSVYDALLAGNPPENICSYQDRLPVVCCPSNNGTSGTTTTSAPILDNRTTTTTLPSINAKAAKRMCAKYAKLVYELHDPPVLMGHAKPVNVSVCAITSEKLIVGGTRAEPMEFPHMAAIGYNTGAIIRWDCGGTLISNSFILTAAHCLTSPQWGNAQWVRVGDLNLQQITDNAWPQDRRIVQWIPHPNYKRVPQYDDIALLKLQLPVNFNAYVRPACLDITGNYPLDGKALATGWGVVDWFVESESDDLMKVVLPIVDQATCQSFYSEDKVRLPNGIDGQTQLCAGEPNKDTCTGDSGGPLVIYNTDETCMYTLIAVTSFGQLCGSVSPGVYTRIYPYVPWIQSIVWSNSR